MMRGTLHLTVESIGAARGSLVMLDDDGAIAEGCSVQQGLTQPLQTEQLSEVVEQGLAGWVLKTRQPALVESTRDDPRWLSRTWEQDVDKSALSVPLVVNERVAGVLTLVREQPQQFTEADLELVARHAVGE
jgi:GAF domain-containing protein